MVHARSLSCHETSGFLVVLLVDASLHLVDVLQVGGGVFFIGWDRGCATGRWCPGSSRWFVFSLH